MSLFSGVGASPSVGPTSGGLFYAYDDITGTAQQVAPANPSRVKITFHNPGGADVYIGPAFIQNTGSDVALSASALGGWFLLSAGAAWPFEGECQKPWQAFTASESPQSLTVIDSNA